MKKIVLLAKKHSATLLYLVFFASALFEFILFTRYVKTDITPFYPLANDQSSFFMMIYPAFVLAKKMGFFHSVINSPVLATGVFFPIQAVLVFLIIGASRFHALLINFSYFILLQLFVVSTCRRLFHSVPFAIFALGALLAVNAPFIVPGGISDFRMDFLAFCCYGLFVTGVLRSRIFLDTRWTLLSAFLAILMMLTRTITAVYFFGIIFFLLIYFVSSYFQSRYLKINALDTVKRIKNFFLFTGITTIVIIPTLWMNRLALYNYYVVGHVTGQEKYIRASMIGIHDTWESLTYYPNALMNGNIELSTIIYLAIIFLVCVFLGRKKSLLIPSQTSNATRSHLDIYFLCLAIIVPLIILTSDMAKSAVVVSVVITPILWLFLIALRNRCNKMTEKISRHALPIIAALTLLFGYGHQIHGYRLRLSAQKKQEYLQLNSMYLALGDYATKKHWKQVKLSVDQIDEKLTSGNLEVLYFENKNIILHVVIEPLGGSIFAISQKNALLSLQNSNVAIFDLNHNPGSKLYPFNASVDKMKPLLIHYLHAHFRLLNTYQIGNQRFGVFVK